MNQGTTLNIILKSLDHIDSALSNFTELIQSACKSSTKHNQSHDNTNNYVQIELRKLIKQDRAARRIRQTYRYPSLKTIYNKLHKKLKEEITLYKNKSFEQYLNSLNINDNSLWFATKKLLKQTKEQYNIKLDNNELAKTDEQKTKAFADHLEKIFIPYDDLNIAHTNYTKNFLESPLQMQLPTKSFSPKEVADCLKSTPRNKAPGADKLIGEILTRLPQKAAVLLCYIFNCISRKGYYPEQLKKSTILMVLKLGKPQTSLCSYRPISLLSVLSKVFEKLLLKRIWAIVINRKGYSRSSV